MPASRTLTEGCGAPFVGLALAKLAVLIHCLYLERSMGWRMVKTASSLKKSRGISCSLGWAGVGMTMPKSWALPSNLGWTVKVSTFSAGSQVRNAFWAGLVE